MKLKTNLIALAVSVILVIIITGSGLVYTEREINNALSANKTITLIVNEVFQLNRLAANVNRAGIQRTRLQWQWKMDGLETLASNFPQGDAGVDKMRFEMVKLNRMLNGYMQTCEDVFSLGNRDSFTRAIQFRVQSLARYLHSMSSLTQKLLDESYTHVQKVRGKQGTFLIVCVASWCILLVFWTLTLWSGIMTPVQKLLHSMAVVRKGNLAHRVAVKNSSHEMNALLISFNAMLDRLEALTKTRKTVFDITDREQAWVGRQLHEEISQIVTGIKLHLAVLKNESSDTNLIGKISFYLDQIQAEIKQILRKMQPVMLDDFGETGIKVEWVRLSTGEAVARLEAEQENPQASIWAGGVGLGHIEAKQKGLTTPYRSPMLKNTPVEYIDPEFFWAGLYIGPIAFATNINRAEELGLEAPESWFDIIDSKYSKLVRVANPNTSGTAYNVITTLLDIFHGDEELTFMFLTHLDNSIEQYTKSGSAGGKSCAIGEIPFAIGYAHDLVRLQANGAPIEITVPEEGTGFEIASMSLVKDGPEPVNAKKLYNWLLQEEAQKLFASWYVVPVSKNAPQDAIAIDVSKLNTVEQDLVWDAENRERLVGRWSAEIGNK